MQIFTCTSTLLYVKSKSLDNDILQLFIEFTLVYADGTCVFKVCHDESVSRLKCVMIKVCHHLCFLLEVLLTL